MAKQFITTSTVTYDIAIDGTTTVTHNIALQNATSDYYATSYTLSLAGIAPIDPIAYSDFGTIPVKVAQDKSKTSITVNFPDSAVGKDAKQIFSISFQDKTLVNKNGEIWEITTPRLGDDTTFDDYQTILRVPMQFGNLAYISPNPSFKINDKGKQVYNFNKDASLKSTITAAFGNFQVFSFKLTYHLENPINQSAVTDIALPPDTNFQKMNYTDMTPKPNKINIDKDGNWIATYSLKAHEKLDVKVEGAVQIFAGAQKYPKNDNESVITDLKPTELWQTTDPQIINLAKQLKTPKAIYDYVTKTLSYDYARVAPNVERLGAVKALQNPKQAICTEFTDLFIAISRAAGIPAREVEGYAYTENPQIQPLSLVADVLHAWPEYWDVQAQAWVPVDPTWGSTSGIDYFSKLDLRHFAFVIHGADPKKPYPAGSYKQGPNPQKDIEVTFGSLPAERISNLNINNTIISQLPFSDEIINTKITNSGPVAVYDENLQVYFDGKATKTSKNIDIVPPFSFYETKINVPYSFLGQKTPQKVELVINGQQKSEFVSYKTFLTICNLLFLCIFIFGIVFMIYLVFRDAKARKYSK